MPLALYVSILVLSISKLMVGTINNDNVIDSPESRIIGGQDCHIVDYPYVVQLKKLTENIFFCSGSLITKKWVLTAAHCLTTVYNTDEIIAVTGSTFLISTKEYYQEIRVVEIRKHPEYGTSPVQNDIALLKLEAPAQTSSTTQLGKLPSDGYTQNCTVVDILGWGRTNNNLEASKVLQCAKVNLIPLSDCIELWKEEIFDQMLCTNEPMEPCYGDSGGPLVCDSIIVGIVSKGACAGNYPAVYTKVENFVNYIKSEIETGDSSGAVVCTRNYFLLVLLCVFGQI